MHILIGDKLESGVANGAQVSSSEVTLVNNDSICEDGRDKCQAIRDSSGCRIPVKGDNGERVAEDSEQERQVSKSWILVIPIGDTCSLVLREPTYPMNHANL